jgi:hypothetical protein
MKIALIHTSRGRPKEALETAKAWIEKAPEGMFQYHFGVEETDREAYTDTARYLYDKAYITWFKKDAKKRVEYEDIEIGKLFALIEEDTADYYTANTKGLLLASQATRQYSPNWYICVADNVYPCADFFDRLLPILYGMKDDDKPRILTYHKDALRGLISHPIFNFSWFILSGEIQYRGYYHLYGDNELFLRSMFDQSLFVMPTTITKDHRHVCFGTAPPDEQSCTSNHKFVYERDGLIYQRRREELLRGFIRNVVR